MSVTAADQLARATSKTTTLIPVVSEKSGCRRQRLQQKHPGKYEPATRNQKYGPKKEKDLQRDWMVLQAGEA